MQVDKVRILAVSDLHHGSVFGLMPPEFETNDGREILLNVGQRYLWECWLDLCEWASHQSIDAIVFNGDCIDGKQPKSRGGELCLGLMSEQTRAAARSGKFLTEACDDPAVYVIKGTPYHSGECGDDEQHFATKLGAGKALEYLDLDVNGVIVNFLHGIGGGGGFYRATGADREATFSALAGKEGKSLRADCLVRSHVHYFFHLEHPTKHVVITPCWQLATSHALKNSMYKFQPDIGAALIEVDPAAKKRGDDPITISKRLYPLPAVKPLKLKVNA